MTANITVIMLLVVLIRSLKNNNQNYIKFIIEHNLSVFAFYSKCGEIFGPCIALVSCYCNYIFKIVSFCSTVMCDVKYVELKYDEIIGFKLLHL